MSDDVEKCKKEIEALKSEIESKRSDENNSALTDAAGSSTACTSPFFLFPHYLSTLSPSLLNY
jgi:hypothetical protein